MQEFAADVGRKFAYSLFLSSPAGNPVPGYIGPGIWLTRWSWLHGAEKAIGSIAAFMFICIWIDHRILQIVRAAMEEMDEDIEKRFEELREKLEIEP